MSNDYILAIDNGTQSVRALIFDLHGHLVDKAQVEITSYQSPQPGWVENDAEAFWAALCMACQRLWANTQVPKGAIRGIVVTTQRGTVGYFAREAEANWIARHQPALWARTEKFLLLSGYLNYRFTGRFVDSVASQVGYIPFDYKRGRWASARKPRAP